MKLIVYLIVLLAHIWTTQAFRMHAGKGDNDCNDCLADCELNADPSDPLHFINCMSNCYVGGPCSY